LPDANDEEDEKKELEKKIAKQEVWEERI